MRYVTRIHLSDCGWREAFYPGTTIDLRNPRTGRPEHTVFSLENTGGKTSFLALVLSCFDPHEKRFLKTLIRPNQQFGDYFGNLPAFILVEWDLSGGQESLLEPLRLVTGQVVVPRGEGRERELDRHFFAFRTARSLALESIPAPGLEGFDQFGRLNGHRDVTRWLHEMRSGHPGNFQNFAKHKDWKRRLAEEKIDTELLARQVDFNRSEGGIEDFLSFRNESQFVRMFLSMTVPDSEAVAVRGVLEDHVRRLSDLPQLQRRRDALRELAERFAPFVETADAERSAREELARRNRHASSLRAALARHRGDASRRAARFVEQASGHEAAAAAAAAKRREARVRHASAAVESARRRHEAVRMLAETRERELAEAKTRRRLLEGALVLREIRDDRARSDELQRAIDAQHADLEPRRDELREMGADLKATLGRRAENLRERQLALTAEAGTLKAAAREADEARRSAEESALADRREVNRIERDIQHAQTFRVELERKRVLESGESAEAAAERHARAARSAGAEAHELRRRAEEKDGEAKERLRLQSPLNAERSGLEVEIRSAREEVQAGEATRRTLALDSTILKLTGESEVDPAADSVARVLSRAKSESAVTLRDSERRREVSEVDRESLESTGLASIDKDVREVADRLRESGIRDAQPYAAYLSGILPSPGEVRRFAELDPARFVGVAVFSRDSLERAREILKPVPALGRPVVVAVAGDNPGGGPDDGFVLPVDQDAAYDRTAARELQRRIEATLSEIAESIRAEQERFDRLEALLRAVDAWRGRFGGGRLDELRRGIDRMEARTAEIEREVAALASQSEADERDARACRARADETERQAHACSGHAERAREHHERWESHVGDWGSERLRHEHAARASEQLASEEAAKRDARADEALDRKRQADDAGNQAAGMEREAVAVTYAAPGGRVRDDLDALRRDYEQRRQDLSALEGERVDHLRGQKTEIDRTVAKNEDLLAKKFGDLRRVELAAEAAQDDLREAADVAETALDKARAGAAEAIGRAENADKEYRSEKERRTREVQPQPLVDLRSPDSTEIDRIVQAAEQTIVEQEALEKHETGAAQRARGEAARNERLAKDCGSWVDTLGGVMGDDAPSADDIGLPRDEEIPKLVSTAVSSLKRAHDGWNEARDRVYASYEEIRKFANSEGFRRIESEAEVAAHLHESDALVAAHSARKTAGLVEDRLKTIEHDLSRLDDDLEACVGELDRLLNTARSIMRRMIRDGRIPQDVPRFGGQPVFRMSADLSRVAATQRREILRSYVSDLAEADRVPQTGQDVAAELVDRMTAALGRSTLGIRLLKPKGEGDTEHMPIDQVTVSGGELLTAAMMIYLVLARLRAESMHGGPGESGVLIMDNPLGKANKALLLQTQIGLADAMGIQLFYTTGVQDTSALAEFENIVRLRRSRRSPGTGRIHVEVEAMRTHIDKLAEGGGARSADAPEKTE
ncbi:MAG: hypothetical protein OXG35_32800 [Acidobacteria bacterium]|nr:hypothetical protein [Acidobacteriota bacterium]